MGFIFLIPQGSYITRRDHMSEIIQQYLTIGKTAKTIAVEPHILRYWEKKIPQIRPIRINNRRFYTRDHVDLLLKLKVLIIDHHHTLEGARHKLFGRSENDNKLKQSLTINQAFNRLLLDLNHLLEVLA